MIRLGGLEYKETEEGLQVRDPFKREWRLATVLEQRYYWHHMASINEIPSDRSGHKS